MCESLHQTLQEVGSQSGITSRCCETDAFPVLMGFFSVSSVCGFTQRPALVSNCLATDPQQWTRGFFFGLDASSLQTRYQSWFRKWTHPVYTRPSRTLPADCVCWQGTNTSSYNECFRLFWALGVHKKFKGGVCLASDPINQASLSCWRLHLACCCFV